ncbi:hypothetical protein [Lachnoclostridium sp. Marseille-P6806]|uniref:hypothetical protein n=1 Tax=Lachnoclostridium sp. Marseille-P6806 TaxID=2364793 RepID=UPI002ED5C18A
MGFDDEDFDKIRAIYPKRPGKTSSILYKQAGNSIVVDVLEAILNEIYRRQNCFHRRQKSRLYGGSEASRLHR